MKKEFASAGQRKLGLSDDELLDLVQQSSLNYFWEFGHQESGMARERTAKPNDKVGMGYDIDHTVTTGGTGFGIMAMIAGAKRGFIANDNFAERMHKICDFLETCSTHNGAFPHFLDGRDGKNIEVFPHDDGSDIVETSFLAAGLLCARQYLAGHDPALAKRITDIWENIEWDSHVRGDNLMWHASPNHAWTDNSLKIKGWNECLITFVMGASSPTHPIDKSVYEKGWKDSDVFKNGKQSYGVTLPLGPDLGGPLFFSHYSFLGLDPRGLNDGEVDYFEQNRNHTLINLAYCMQNPEMYVGYSDNCWGLTASDNHECYSAHSPTNDLGVITPTAALSAMPYTPDESMKALRHFYDDMGDKIWGTCGFVDAFNETEGWYGKSNLAIDQGPIVVMIENHRSGLLWDLFMSCPEIQAGLKKLGFESPHLKAAVAPSAPEILPPPEV